ncbi:peroxiredoxin [Qipengyuania sediminis]|uniref:peroxiredoxin n=1 Tax=Qipengyuania sediminis TaxID=1532023 RepID=UPI001059ACF4|nr:peroxiredoxin [Qipengyuania sediminis]
MIRTLFAVAALALAAAPTAAALPQGAKAPMFSAKGARAGKPVPIDLRKELRRGPVVLYFFPAAFTSGCNIEANAFAAKIAEFRKAGATVIGMTGGHVNRLIEFSAKECAGQFTVAAATPQVIKAYDVSLAGKPGWTTRTTYVIDRQGRIADAFTDMAPQGHISRSLAAVKSLAAR